MIVFLVLDYLVAAFISMDYKLTFVTALNAYGYRFLVIFIPLAELGLFLIAASEEKWWEIKKYK